MNKIKINYIIVWLKKKTKQKITKRKKKVLHMQGVNYEK